MHYYQHHIGDFIKDTSFLTNEEVGIYMKLIWLYYDTESALPNDTPILAIKLNCRGLEQTVRNILGLYFRLIDDQWHHTRCDDEIAHYHKQLEVASKAGKASAAKRKGIAISTPVEHPLNARTTSVQLTNNQEPITNNHIKTTPPPDGVSVDLWSDFLVYRKRLKSPVTPRVLARLIKEADLAKMPLADVLETIIFKGWKSFDATWVVAKTGATVPKNNQAWRTDDNLMMAKANELGLHTIGLQRYDIINKIDATLRSRGL